MQSWHRLAVIIRQYAPHNPAARSHTQDKADAAIACSVGNQKEKLYAR